MKSKRKRSQRSRLRQLRNTFAYERHFTCATSLPPDACARNLRAFDGTDYKVVGVNGSGPYRFEFNWR